MRAPRLHGFGAQHLELVAHGLDPQELKKVHRLGRIDTDRLERAAHLLGDGFGLVAVIETAAVAQELEQREVRDVAAVGDAVRLEPGDLPAAEPPAELVEEARLADAGLPRDADDLCLARQRRGQPALVEEIELLAAAHEARHPTTGAKAGALGAEQPVARRASRQERRQREAPLEEGRRGGRHHDLEELALRRAQRQVADLVEEERAARGLERPGVAARRR